MPTWTKEEIQALKRTWFRHEVAEAFEKEKGDEAWFGAKLRQAIPAHSIEECAQKRDSLIRDGKWYFKRSMQTELALIVPTRPPRVETEMPEADIKAELFKIHVAINSLLNEQIRFGKMLAELMEKEK
jgi:hypothetical protein